MVVTGAKEGIVVNQVAKVLNIENVEIDTPDQSMIQIENTTDITINGKRSGNDFRETVADQELTVLLVFYTVFIVNLSERKLKK